MQVQEEFRVGQTIALQRSGHSSGSCEQAVIVAIRGDVLLLRWPDGRETFVPARTVRLH